MSTHAIAQKYVELALAIDQHFPGYIDAYFGPAEWKERAREKRPLNELASEAADLANVIRQDSEMDSQRCDFLAGQARAMQTTVRLLQGERMTLTDEVAALYDITPEWIPESVFDEAHRALDALLPKGDSLIQRLDARKKATTIAVERVKSVLPFISERLRELTRQRFPLPADESLEIQFVTNQPWRGYNWYLGQHRSRIDVNTDLPLYVIELTNLIAHEGYPGHHTELSNKEARLMQQAGCIEYCLALINSPSCVVAEGIATRAFDVLMSDAEQITWHREELYPRAGFGHLDAQREHAIDRARLQLAGVRGNAAFLLHDRGANAQDVMEYIQRYALQTEDEARKAVDFISHPLFRSYTFTYYYGGALLENLLAEQNTRDARFTRLLTEPITPSQIRLWKDK